MTRQHDASDAEDCPEQTLSNTGQSIPPELFTADEAANVLGVSGNWLRQQLRARRFAGVKIAGRWCMTGQQITDAITTMSTTALPPEPPSPAGLARNSRFRRRINLKGTS